MRPIIFNNQEYPCRDIFIKEFGNVTISTVSLNDAIMNNSTYSSEEARFVDEKIFFFVEENELTLPDNVLSKYINEQL